MHALVGENGAGKSTLMRVLGGEMQPTSGQVTLDGQPVTLADPSQARARGIAIIHQEMALAPDLSVAENIFLGELPRAIAWSRLRKRAGELMAKLGFDIDPAATVGSLSVAHQQVVEIAKALSLNARIIVFDEPTAVLAAGDAERLLEIIRALRAEGVGIVYISHRLDEVFRISDRITVMKDGRVAGVVSPKEVDTDGLIKLMVGRSLRSMFAERSSRRIGDEVLRVEGLNAGRKVRDVGFSVRAGEVVGLAGLVGSGRTEVVRLIFGADRMESGKVFLRGKQVHIRGPADAVQLGIGLVPESRKDHGVVLPLSDPRQHHHGQAPAGGEPGRLHQVPGGAAPGRPAARGAPHQGLEHRGPGVEPLRRQPAEGGAGQVVPRRLRPDHPGRADARRGRRREERDLRPHREAWPRPARRCWSSPPSTRSCSASATGSW